MSKQAFQILTHTWEKNNQPLSITTTLLDEDRIISGILLERNVVDVVQENHLGELVNQLKNDITLLQASLKLKCEELKKVEDERALFLKDKKEKEKRVIFIQSLMGKRELYVAEQKLGEQSQPMTEEDKEFHRRLLTLRVDNEPDLNTLEEWGRLRHSSKVRQILKEQEDAYWKMMEEEHFQDLEDSDGDDGGGQELDMPIPDTPPVEPLPMSFPPLPEDKHAISTEIFFMFQPVRILRGQNAGIKAYFQTFVQNKKGESTKRVSVMLNKDPLINGTVYHSSITAIPCSTDGCTSMSTVPLKTYPYDFDTHLCKEHQH